MSLSNLSQIENFHGQTIDKIWFTRNRLKSEIIPSAVWVPLIVKWKQLLKLSCQELSEIQHQKDFVEHKKAHEKIWSEMLDFEAGYTLADMPEHYKEFDELEDEIYQYKPLRVRQLRIILQVTLHKLLERLRQNDFSAFLELATLTTEEELELRPVKKNKPLTYRQLAWIWYFKGENTVQSNLKELLDRYKIPYTNLQSVIKHLNVRSTAYGIRKKEITDSEQKRSKNDIEPAINYLQSQGESAALKKAEELYSLLSN